MRVLTISLIMLLLLAVAHQRAAAQPANSLLTTWNNGAPAGSGTGNWNVGSNWSGGTVPNNVTEDSAVINGGGTAQVNSVIANAAGGVLLGQGTVAGQSGTLEILSGGNLQVLDSGPTFPDDGIVRVGQNINQGDPANPNNGTGTLRVLPGGTLTSNGITLGGEVASSITLGAAAPATATTVTVNNGAVTLGRTLRVIGPNVNFTSSGTGAGIAFLGTSILIPEITGGTHSALKTTGAATLGGTLQVDFNGVTPTGGNSWNLLDTANVVSSFASVLPDAGVPMGLGQVLQTRTVNGGTNGKLVQLFVNQLAVLSVNRNTGAVSITNPGAAGIDFDGYTIQSTAGALNTANWQSLATHPAVAGAGWSEANPTANRVSEIRSAGMSTLGASGSWGVGNLFQQPTPVSFGQNLEDITFQFTGPSGGTVNGVVNYTGSAGINNLVLFVDPATGNVKIRNTSTFSVGIEAYTITSAAGSLNSTPALWTSLQDQPGTAGAGWAEANLSDNRVSELRSQGGGTTLNPNGGTTFDLGGLFKTASAKDLVFQFLLTGNAVANTGVVLYEAASTVGVLGDYNNNGTVDAADYVVWRNNGPLQNDPTPGVQAADYDFWRMRFGATSGAGSGSGSGVGQAAALVPEPATWVSLLIFGTAAAGALRRKGQSNR